MNSTKSVKAFTLLQKNFLFFYLKYFKFYLSKLLHFYTTKKTHPFFGGVLKNNFNLFLFKHFLFIFAYGFTRRKNIKETFHGPIRG